MSAAEPVTVHILDREYLIACTPDERDGLLAAASYLDGKMREVRAAARAPGAERIAVLAALNIAHELVTLKQHNQSEASTISQHMQALKIKLDSALAGSIK
ncbi:cell division protein ZapA [Pseudolysobacter antarcticus]|uniref:Cell division protein ZapA n=1 Tax=Pseudolysobacter antarcticus TaxID=2511995 RepID=A0A411HFY0_9GAMM|nr:cell division protein ZapA [Pseudolysobacter antarcticus]QBB69371.1 cell division protein ZapA [Pseudolysobacter antarcticus]